MLEILIVFKYNTSYIRQNNVHVQAQILETNKYERIDYIA